MTVRKRQCAGAGRDAYHLEPSQMNTIPAKMNARSRALALRFFSLNSSAPQMKEMITDPLLTSEMTEIIESGWFRAVRYAKSAADMNTDIRKVS